MYKYKRWREATLSFTNGNKWKVLEPDVVSNIYMAVQGCSDRTTQLTNQGIVKSHIGAKVLLYIGCGIGDSRA